MLQGAHPQDCPVPGRGCSQRRGGGSRGGRGSLFPQALRPWSETQATARGRQHDGGHVQPVPGRSPYRHRASEQSRRTFPSLRGRSSSVINMSSVPTPSSSPRSPPLLAAITPAPPRTRSDTCRPSLRLDHRPRVGSGPVPRGRSMIVFLANRSLDASGLVCFPGGRDPFAVCLPARLALGA